MGRAFFLSMNTFRNTLKANYTTVPNEVLEDVNLSWKAKGIFCLLASKPDNWNFYMEQIAGHSADKLSSLKSGVKELEEQGYLSRKNKFDAQNKICGMDWILTVPVRQISRQAEIPSDGNSVGRKTYRHSKTNNSKTNNSNTNNTNISLRQKTEWFIDFWNKINHAEVRFTEKKQKQVYNRLKVFKADEIVQSIKNRSNDAWLENNGYMKDWDSFWRNNEKVERYLNKENDRRPF